MNACDNTDNFASISDGDVEVQQASEAKKEIQAVVQKEIVISKKKIGGKKRKSMNIVSTVGEKNLGKKKETKKSAVSKKKETKKSAVSKKEETKKSAVSKKEETKKSAVSKKEETKKSVVSKKKETKKSVVSKKKVSKTYIEIKISYQTKRASKPAEKKLDLLFYMHDRDAGCIQHIRAFSEEKGFLKSLNHLDWQASFFYYSQDEAILLPLEFSNGKSHNIHPDFVGFKEDYVLSKGEYSAELTEQLFNTTLQSVYPDDEQSSESIMDLNSNWYVANPLSGLDVILSAKAKGSVRSDSHVVALVFGYDFPYYSTVEWKKFFKKHKNVSVIAMSGRSANVSNFLHIWKKRNLTLNF